MKHSLDCLKLPTPMRVSVADDVAALLEFALICHAQTRVAIATLIEVRGGAARALGSHVVVAADGRYAGYLSGGCVEAALAFEALLAIEAGKDRVVTFGDGSPFFDIILPCGGGITVVIHILREPDEIVQVLTCLEQRRTTALKLSVEKQALTVTAPPATTGWIGHWFHILYRPRIRIVISGQTVEARSVAKLARGCGYDVVFISGQDVIANLTELIDPYTAVLLLHHDMDQEQPALQAALRSKPFYIGALGSSRTHERRLEELQKAGFRDEDLTRIRAPIGLFGPTRDSTSLALSVLAEVAATRLTGFK
ncbi:XdhC family protein [Rhizobium sp. TH135]|uniref:XdhC family protein n=1 Tax=Rhizobium sp. TH135 TaxID=2067451 RepID=UPI001FDF4336|nr:XdhC family protein [Rhizobium sp. TH135]